MLKTKPNSFLQENEVSNHSTDMSIFMKEVATQISVRVRQVPK